MITFFFLHETKRLQRRHVFNVHYFIPSDVLCAAICLILFVCVCLFVFECAQECWTSGGLVTGGDYQSSLATIETKQ